MNLVRIAVRVAAVPEPDWSKVTGWSIGRDPTEYGWVIDGFGFNGSDLLEVQSEEDLLGLGVPQPFIDAAEAAGLGPDEFDVFLMGNSKKYRTSDELP